MRCGEKMQKDEGTGAAEAEAEGAVGFRAHLLNLFTTEMLFVF
jgi:hypothetical protein